MNKLIILPILAVLLTGCGAFGGSNDEPLAATPPTNADNTTSVAITPATTTTVIKTDARIDAASFLDALVKSGCEIDKAEYKEVIRGGGIAVTCTKTKDLLSTEGIENL